MVSFTEGADAAVVASNAFVFKMYFKALLALGRGLCCAWWTGLRYNGLCPSVVVEGVTVLLRLPVRVWDLFCNVCSVHIKCLALSLAVSQSLAVGACVDFIVSLVSPTFGSLPLDPSLLHQQLLHSHCDAAVAMQLKRFNYWTFIATIPCRGFAKHFIRCSTTAVLSWLSCILNYS